MGSQFIEKEIQMAFQHIKVSTSSYERNKRYIHHQDVTCFSPISWQRSPFLTIAMLGGGGTDPLTLLAGLKIGPVSLEGNLT